MENVSENTGKNSLVIFGIDSFLVIRNYIQKRAIKIKGIRNKTLRKVMEMRVSESEKKNVDGGILQPSGIREVPQQLSSISPEGRKTRENRLEYQAEKMKSDVRNRP